MQYIDKPDNDKLIKKMSPQLLVADIDDSVEFYKKLDKKKGQLKRMQLTDKFYQLLTKQEI